MFNIRVIQSNYGDCFLLEFGTSANPKYALIDGGPKDVWDNHLKDEMKAIATNGHKLEFVAISHADSDHITGILDFFSEIEALGPSDNHQLPAVEALWYNSFEKTIDRNGAGISSRLRDIVTSIASPQLMAHSNFTLQSFDLGNQLRIKSQLIGLDINPGFEDEVIIVDGAQDLVKENMLIKFVGPTQANLDELRDEWLNWLDENDDLLVDSDPQALANSDRSVKNLSSIMFLVEADSKTVLFTGDGRSDHLLQGLEQAGLLDDNGRMHVDVLKVMHHGSDRNVTRTFFRKVSAKTYIISANGHPDNPDLSTLIWIVEAAKEMNRQIKLIATNETRSIRKLVEEYPSAEYGYQLEVMSPSANHRLIELA